MASSEVDQKFLGKLAKAVENDNPLLASVLFKILGLSINLSQQLLKARKHRRQDGTPTAEQLHLSFHIIWLSREGLVLLEQYVVPMVGNYVELKVLAYKLRASFYHIFVLFHNTPPVTGGSGSDSGQDPPASASRIDKGKGVARDGHRPEGGPVAPPPGFGPEPPSAFLMKPGNYLPTAHRFFQEAVQLADSLLWGSHSLRLSVKTEYAAFLYECVHDTELSRKVAKDTVAEVYDATEGIDNDMFNDACELVTVLGKMMKRGLPSSTNNTSRKASGSSQATQRTTDPPPPSYQEQQQQQQQPKQGEASAPYGMI
ncbi:14-3-3 domain-containing protein [Podospora fimiseda]|uniref:14-3-3 domain-containing protein n=1 Tax=Podospora fimiseda TaxID=252190 RepID=A0AAN7BP45_9PEZI|nr:14-3-3 domain-containing protein [Podospora fimiseda]